MRGGTIPVANIVATGVATGVVGLGIAGGVKRLKNKQKARTLQAELQRWERRTAQKAQKAQTSQKSQTLLGEAEASKDPRNQVFHGD